MAVISADSEIELNATLSAPGSKQKRRSVRKSSGKSKPGFFSGARCALRLLARDGQFTERSPRRNPSKAVSWAGAHRFGPGYRNGWALARSRIHLEIVYTESWILRSKVYSNGTLRFSLPLGMAEADHEVRVTVEPVATHTATSQSQWEARVAAMSEIARVSGLLIDDWH